MMASPGRQLLLLLALACTFPAGSYAQKRVDKNERADEIVARVEQRYAGLRDYTVTLDVTVDIPGVNIPPVHATMYFKQPDKVLFKSESFALLPREAAGLGIGRIRASNTVEDSVAREVLDGTTKLRITMLPKADKTHLQRVSLYVDPDRWTADRAVTALPDGRLVTADFLYQHQAGLWLPSSLTLSFTSSGVDTVEMSAPRPPAASWTPGPPRQGRVLVKYSQYQINTDLSDDIFKPQETEEQTAHP